MTPILCICDGRQASGPVSGWVCAGAVPRAGSPVAGGGGSSPEIARPRVRNPSVDALNPRTAAGLIPYVTVPGPPPGSVAGQPSSTVGRCWCWFLG